MGFWDSMRGVGRALGGVLETAVETLGPPLMQVGTQALMNLVAPGQGGGGYQPRYSTYPTYGGYSPSPYAGFPPVAAPAPRVNVPQGWTPIPAGVNPYAQAPAPTYAPTGYGVQPASLMEWGAGLGALGAQLFSGGQQMPAIGTEGQGFGSELMERFSGAVSGLPTMFRYGPQTARPVRELQAVNPATGKIAIWKYAGRPILYTGDLAACKRVQRISRRVARRRPR